MFTIAASGERTTRLLDEVVTDVGALKTASHSYSVTVTVAVESVEKDSGSRRLESV
jgi:hypothetical protein